MEHLIRMYRDPSDYLWIEIESGLAEVGALDDIVVARADGSFELVQVKMTVDDNHYPLDWTWLITARGAGRSLIKKWFDGYRRARSLGEIASASLMTNRRPDADFQRALIQKVVDFDRLPNELRDSLLAQLGDLEEVRHFFSQFQFDHSRPFIDTLEDTLKWSLVPTDTDESGWLYFRHMVRSWAMRKQLPAPDGRITINTWLRRSPKHGHDPCRKIFLFH